MYNVQFLLHEKDVFTAARYAEGVGLVSALLGTKSALNPQPSEHSQYSHSTGMDILLLVIPSMTFCSSLWGKP